MEREDKVRLINHITYLENELEDFKNFKSLSWEAYNKNRDARRNVERWIENIINSTVNIAKIILLSEGLTRPETYKEMVNSLSLVSVFEKENIARIAEWDKLRNIIVHEYLAVRWNAIKSFIQETEPLYMDFVGKIKEYLKSNLGD